MVVEDRCCDSFYGVVCACCATAVTSRTLSHASRASCRVLTRRCHALFCRVMASLTRRDASSASSVRPALISRFFRRNMASMVGVTKRGSFDVVVFLFLGKIWLADWPWSGTCNQKLFARRWRRATRSSVAKRIGGRLHVELASAFWMYVFLCGCLRHFSAVLYTQRRLYGRSLSMTWRPARFHSHIRWHISCQIYTISHRVGWLTIASSSY